MEGADAAENDAENPQASRGEEPVQLSRPPVSGQVAVALGAPKSKPHPTNSRGRGWYRQAPGVPSGHGVAKRAAAREEWGYTNISEQLGRAEVSATVEAPHDEHLAIGQCLDPLDGSPLGTADLPSNAMPEVTFRDFAVPDSGGVLYSVRTPEGMTLQRYTCR